MSKNNKNHSISSEKGIEEKVNTQSKVQNSGPQDINSEGNIGSEISQKKTEDTGSNNKDPEIKESKDIFPEGNADTETYSGKIKSDQLEGIKNYDSEAKELMEKNHIKQIWRCPVTGYWFTSAESAKEQKVRTGKSLEFYDI